MPGISPDTIMSLFADLRAGIGVPTASSEAHGRRGARVLTDGESGGPRGLRNEALGR